jgi:hypothetical protein
MPLDGQALAMAIGDAIANIAKRGMFTVPIPSEE